jgi:hypothetical protein
MLRGLTAPLGSPEPNNPVLVKKALQSGNYYCVNILSRENCIISGHIGEGNQGSRQTVAHSRAGKYKPQHKLGIVPN